MADQTFSPGFYFELNYQNENYAFQEVSGISMEMDTEDIQSVGENEFKYRLPDAQKVNNLILKRGLVKPDSPLAIWFRDSIESSMTLPISQADIVVCLKDSEGKDLMKWAFFSAYPVKYNSSNFKDNELVFEEVEIAYTHFSTEKDLS